MPIPSGPHKNNSLVGQKVPPLTEEYSLIFSAGIIFKQVIFI